MNIKSGRFAKVYYANPLKNGVSVVNFLVSNHYLAERNLD